MSPSDVCGSLNVRTTFWTVKNDILKFDMCVKAAISQVFFCVGENLNPSGPSGAALGPAASVRLSDWSGLRVFVYGHFFQFVLKLLSFAAQICINW